MQPQAMAEEPKPPQPSDPPLPFDPSRSISLSLSLSLSASVASSNFCSSFSVFSRIQFLSLGLRFETSCVNLYL